MRNRKITLSQFLEKAEDVHKGRYDYSNVVTYEAKGVKIICKLHGEFTQRPIRHLYGSGCPKCSGRNKTTLDIVQEFKDVHGDKYDYTNVVYKGWNTKVKILCKTHGLFDQSPNNHSQGNGCPECSRVAKGKSKTKNILEKLYKDLIQPEDYKLIPLGGRLGGFAKVDNEDFDKVKDYCWYNNGGRASNDKLSLMHRFIMNAPPELEVDHIYHNTLDNRKSKLRLATPQQNLFNKKPEKGASDFKGVSWCKLTERWASSITNYYNGSCLGRFATEEEAARAFDLKAVELRGEWAYQTLNFPELLPEYLKQIEKQHDFK